MKTLGICFGATTMQAVALEVDPEIRSVEKTWRVAHEGNPREAFLDFLRKIDVLDYDRVAVTGRNFRNSVALSTITEPEAVECALGEVYSEADLPQLVLSLGGETQVVYRIGSHGGIISTHAGNKCASGTGEFFLQQIRRMGLGIDEAVALAREGEPHRVAGRCSVFCKSDCTHALNKGIPKQNVVAGLCRMMADKLVELIKDMDSDRVAVIGGGSLNTALVDMLKKKFEGLSLPACAEAFEAFGAALWAAENPCRQLPSRIEAVVSEFHHSFGTHPPLRDAGSLVEFRSTPHGKAEQNDTCIVGLDVGSTTTKAVVMRTRDQVLLASIYLRTNGDPVAASRECYAQLLAQIGSTPIEIIGLGVTGSGRHVAGLHALTDNVINEIVAHAAAAAYFDPEVDTIFEIGGQDAKYTYLTGGVASDYAMNEACSAGTGSFLEESAYESLNVATERIGDLAMKGTRPPNFTDQCAAFISSDVKRAAQEGIDRENILAGLVYSVCMNYLNRVKGARPVGKKIFMQGGVCYNKAVPVAMASLMQAPIVVPPDPGLMGAFGVALEVAKRLESNTATPGHFDLSGLAHRESVREGSFVCAGGKGKCDRKCEISRIRIEGKVYPFGGICSKYENQRRQKTIDTAELDLVALRQKLLLEDFGVAPKENSADEGQGEWRTVGISRAFLTNSLYPLYSTFFGELGFGIVLSDPDDTVGASRVEAPFCFPAELAHAAFYNLLQKKPDYLFVPQVMQIPVENVPTYSRACVFVQGEPYYLRSTFRNELESSPSVVLAPILKMGDTYEQGAEPMVAMAKKMGIPEKRAASAYAAACDRQRAFEKELRRIGRETLDALEKDKDRFGVVLFGRPYNAFASEANMGIPHKIASKGVVVIPHDMLPADGYNVDKKMFWAMGQKIMKAAQYVKLRDDLFGFYVTNFSCGPDSFLLGYFRNCMAEKPSLTLELDQHTADAGIDTRIEAALDIITAYRHRVQGRVEMKITTFRPAKVGDGKRPKVISSEGKVYDLTDPHVEVIVPSMGTYGSQGAAAVLRSLGINARALTVADKDVFLTGRKNTSCKECLPYILTTGSFIDYLKKKDDPSKVTLCFLATGGGPCRLGQYCRALEQVLHSRRIPNAAVFTVSDENGYGGLGSKGLLRAWQAICVSDVFGDIKSMLEVTARHREAARRELESCWQEVVAYFEGRLSVRFSTLLSNVSARLRAIPLKMRPQEVPVISLLGEIFVRRDEFSRKDIVSYLENRGFMVKVAPVAEYMCYGNYVIHSGLGEKQFGLGDQLKMKLTVAAQEFWERRIKQQLAASGLYHFEMIDVAETIGGVRHLVDHNFRGECILTVGLSMREILNDSCGIISIGPFGCMPSRMAESILNKEMNPVGKARMPGWEDKAREYAEIGTFPFLAIETDGSQFPQLIEAKLESFVLQARRLHQFMREKKQGNPLRHVHRAVTATVSESTKAPASRRQKTSR